MANDTIEIVTGGPATRGFGTRQIDVEELSVNVNLFLDQIGAVLDKTPEKIGSFGLTQFEIQAEITAKGSLALLGTGGEAGVSGGIKFVFRRE